MKAERDHWIVEQHAMGKPDMDIATELLMSVTRVRQVIKESERRARVSAYEQHA